MDLNLETKLEGKLFQLADQRLEILCLRRRVKSDLGIRGKGELTKLEKNLAKESAISFPKIPT